MLSGDHVYKMDYGKMLRFHQEQKAAATIATIEVSREEAGRFGVIRTDARDCVVGFLEKPRPEELGPADDQVLASMGIYIFKMDILQDELEADAAARDVARLRPRHHSCDGRRIGAGVVVPFHDENKKAAEVLARHRNARRATSRPTWTSARSCRSSTCTIPEWPLRTWQVQAPPAKFVFADDDRCGRALDSMISSGCIISGSRMAGSVLCPNVRVHSFCQIEQSILMPGVRVGRHARVAGRSSTATSSSRARRA